jgi:hypothetical protein
MWVDALLQEIHTWLADQINGESKIYWFWSLNLQSCHQLLKNIPKREAKLNFKISGSKCSSLWGRIDKHQNLLTTRSIGQSFVFELLLEHPESTFYWRVTEWSCLLTSMIIQINCDPKPDFFTVDLTRPDPMTLLIV